jgi:hypothetical protein
MKSKMAKQQVAQSLSKQLKRMEALYRNVRLPDQYAGRGVEGQNVKLDQ